MRTRLVLPLLAAVLVGCGSTEPSGADLAGSYTATVFQVTPPGQSAINVIAAGGTLAITITPDLAVTGSIFLPASVTGDVSFSASLAGTATIEGSTVEFEQAADTFVRDLEWALSGNNLTVQGQVVNGTTFTITLTK